MAKKDPKNYDEAYEELQTILQALQNEDTGIEKLSEYVNRAKELQAYCRNRLRDIEVSLNEKKE